MFQKKGSSATPSVEHALSVVYVVPSQYLLYSGVPSGLIRFRYLAPGRFFVFVVAMFLMFVVGELAPRGRCSRQDVGALKYKKRITLRGFCQ